MKLTINFDLSSDHVILDNEEFPEGDLSLFIALRRKALELDEAEKENAKDALAFNLHHREHNPRKVEGCAFCSREAPRIVVEYKRVEKISERNDGVIINKVTIKRFDERGKQLLNLDELEIE